MTARGVASRPLQKGSLINLAIEANPAYLIVVTANSLGPLKSKWSFRREVSRICSLRPCAIMYIVNIYRPKNARFGGQWRVEGRRSAIGTSVGTEQSGRGFGKVVDIA